MSTRPESSSPGVVPRPELAGLRPETLGLRPGSPPRIHPWGKPTRERWFLAMLAVSAFSTLLLFLPFVFVLLFAVTAVVTTQPLYQRVLRGLGGRRTFAALVTTAILGFAVLLPLASTGYLAAGEFQAISREVQEWSGAGGMEALSESVQDSLDGAPVLGEPLLLEDAVQATIPGLTQLLTSVPARLMDVGFDVIVFIVAVIALYAEGPTVTRVVLDLTPIEDRHAARLIRCFEELSHNMVFGSVATGVLQGSVAGLGFWLAGVPHVALLGVAIAIGSFIPVLGTLVVWLPVTLAAWAISGWKTALFLALWNLLITGTIDNFAKPLFVRGRLDIHPALVFLSICGGMLWMGIPGLLVGPVVVAFFIALYRSYREEYLGVDAPAWTGRPYDTLIERLAHARRPPSPDGPA